jgi:hypothetical protein
MTTFYSEDLRQTATYWAPVGIDGFGKKTHAKPVTLNCRWEKKKERYRNPQGEIELSTASVFLEQSVAAGGFMFLGTSLELSPYDEEDALEIVSADEVPELEGEDVTYKAQMNPRL